MSTITTINTVNSIYNNGQRTIKKPNLIFFLHDFINKLLLFYLIKIYLI